MAYSDYGGHAYKDGKFREDHCDVRIYGEGSDKKGDHYPYFFGDKKKDDLPSAHVSLGDKSVRVMLYKQSWFEIWREGKKLNNFKILTQESKDAVPDYQTSYKDDDDQPYFNTDAFLSAGKAAVFWFNGYRLEMFWEETDNHYQYARLTQPDGSVWTGFSGYGVGNGLEECGYGFSTDKCIERLKELFPTQESG